MNKATVGIAHGGQQGKVLYPRMSPRRISRPRRRPSGDANLQHARYGVKRHLGADGEQLRAEDYRKANLAESLGEACRYAWDTCGYRGSVGVWCLSALIWVLFPALWDRDETGGAAHYGGQS